MKPANNMDIFNFYNPNVVMDMAKHYGLEFPDFRWIKDFINTKISMFSYKNLPEDLTTEIIENALCFNNKLCFYNHPILGVVLCRYLPLGKYNIYWKPLEVDLIALNGEHLGRVNWNDIVLARDNTMDIVPFITLCAWIQKVQKCENTLMKQINIASLPMLFKGDKKTIGSINRLIEKTYSSEAFGIADESLASQFEAFNIDFSIHPEQVLEIMKNYINFGLQSFGIYGTGSQKRERLLVGEVQNQTDYVDSVYQDMKKNRQLFVDLVNEKFGCDIELVEEYIENREVEIDLQQEQQTAMQQQPTQSDNKESGDNEE